MELYYFYNIARVTASFFAKTERDLINTFYWGLGIGIALWLGFFVLQGFGLYAMAKKRGYEKKGLAFIPFVNVWYMGKLAGECNFFGQKVKKAGMYAMIAQIVTAVLSLTVLAAEMYLWIRHGAPEVTEMGSAYWPGLKDFSQTVAQFYELSGYLLSIFQLIYEILLVVLLIGLYRRYTPKNYMALGILTLFVPASRYIVIFVLRNRQSIDYEAYMRARREAYMRQQQQYYNRYGNPYNNPYSNPYNSPYGSQHGNGSSRPAPEEPFAEFSSTNNSENSSKENNGDSDGFFD